MNLLHPVKEFTRRRLAWQTYNGWLRVG